MTYPTVAWNPSDICEVKNIYSSEACPVTTGIDLTTGVDVSQYEYVLVLNSVGATTGTTTITLQHSDTLTVSGGGYVAISGMTATFAGTADNNLKGVEVRCHGLKKYMNVNVVNATGTAQLDITLLGFGRQYSVDYASFTSSVAELGLS